MSTALATAVMKLNSDSVKENADALRVYRESVQKLKNNVELKGKDLQTLESALELLGLTTANVQDDVAALTLHESYTEQTKDFAARYQAFFDANAKLAKERARLEEEAREKQRQINISTHSAKILSDTAAELRKLVRNNPRLFNSSFAPSQAPPAAATKARPPAGNAFPAFELTEERRREMEEAHG